MNSPSYQQDSSAGKVSTNYINFTIKAGTDHADVRVNLFGNRGIAALATMSPIKGSSGFFGIGAKITLSVYAYWKEFNDFLPIYDQWVDVDASLTIKVGREIPFVSMTDLRGLDIVRFKLNAIQDNDVVFCLRLTSI